MILNPRTEQAYDLLHRGILALSRTEQAGLRVDLEYIVRMKHHLTRKLDRLQKELEQTKFFHKWVATSRRGVNINSNAQLSKYLYGTMKLKPATTTKTGQGSTNEEALRQLNKPELDMILEMRKLRKVRDTYLSGFEQETVNGYMHPFFNLHLVRSYRSSGSDPNFQNIPMRDRQAMQICRRAIYPRPGHQLLEIDYSSLEVRVSACYHRDPTMLRYIKNTATDMHRDMAKQIFLLDSFDRKIPAHDTLRKATKNGFVFPQFYGDYYEHCAEGLCQWGELPRTTWKSGQGIEMPGGHSVNWHLADHMRTKGITSYKKFTRHLQEIEDDFWGNRFADYATWKDRWWRAYQKHGYIDMLTGFRCSGVMTRNEVINIPIQGSAFHCLLWAFISVDKVMREEHWKSRLIGQIHDSMLLDVHPEEIKHVTHTVQRITCEDLPKAWDWIIVPLEIEAEVCPVDGAWSEKESYPL